MTDRRDPGKAAALDRDYLRRQAMNDPGLEAELLSLLLAQVEAVDGLLAAAGPAERAAIGHRLAGGARSLGAFRLAAAARALAHDGADEAAGARLAEEARHLARLLRGAGGSASVD